MPGSLNVHPLEAVEIHAPTGIGLRAHAWPLVPEGAPVLSTGDAGLLTRANCTHHAFLHVSLFKVELAVEAHETRMP